MKAEALGFTLPAVSLLKWLHFNSEISQPARAIYPSYHRNNLTKTIRVNRQLKFGSYVNLL